MHDPRRNEMLKTDEGRRAVVLEMLESIKGCAEDLIDLSHRDDWASTLAQLEDVEEGILQILGNATPAIPLGDIKRLEAQLAANG